MSIESARAYVERLKTDKEFAAAAGAVKTEEQASAFIAEHGFDFTSAEFAAAVPRELSASELAGAVGGQDAPNGYCRKCLWIPISLVFNQPF